MKKFIIFLLVCSSLLAQERAKIALVLSGGGARGGAHAGVLKVLEEKNIPIDMIIGTSMGSFVGGLYASGKTPEEIEHMLVTSPWKEYIRTDFNRPDTPMRKKELEYRYQGRLGLGIDTENNIVLPTGVFKRQPLLFKFMQETEDSVNTTDFDKLPIPFAAVATNIQNGDKVVLKSGSLAKAIYASSSIPGGLQPIRINGLDLVDGGVSDNMPIAVARDMGADIIIAVDVSEKFEKNLKVDSYFVVMGQLVNILMRKNANQSIATLGIDDILITPDLKGFTGLDADKYEAIIQKGEEAAQKAYSGVLEELSLSDEEYAKYKKKHRKKLNSNTIIIDEIQIDNPTYISDDSILARMSIKVGDELDPHKLREELLHIYNMMIFDSIEYSLVKKNSKNILVITTTPSWDNHGEVRFALGIEDDFEGHSAYSLKAGYTMFGLNEYGGEWKTDFEIGRTKLVQTELFQPFDPMQRYYVRPSVMYFERLDLVPASAFGLSGNSNIELGIKRYGGSLALGAHVTTDYEFELGISNYVDKLDVELFKSNEKYNAIPMYASFKADSLDNLNFPNSGYKTQIMLTKEMHDFGSDYDYEQFYADLEIPFSISNNNITAYFKYGDTFNDTGENALAGNFRLGGLFNLSGYVPYSLNGENMVLGILRYRYRIKDGGFFGALNSPLYAGFSLESGNAWSNDETFKAEELKNSATIYVAADTFLGPFYLAYGATDDAEQSVYLYLGEKF